MPGERFRFGDNAVGAHDERRSAHRRRAAAVRVAAVVRDRRVAAQNHDVLDWNAEAIGNDLREARFLPLAVRRGAGDHRYFP